MENEVSPQTKALFIFHFPMTQTNSNLEWALSSNHLKKTGLYEWAADPDTEKHFDTVDHDRLISILREEINDAPTLHLIRSFLKAEVMGVDWSA